MLIANEIIQTVHEHSKMTTLHEGGGGGGYFMFSSGNYSNIFGQDYS